MIKLKDIYDGKNWLTGRKASEVKEERLTEVKSNIMQKWDTATVIQNDIEEFVNNAMQAGGPELLSKVHTALKNATEHARRVYRKG